MHHCSSALCFHYRSLYSIWKPRRAISPLPASRHAENQFCMRSQPFCVRRASSACGELLGFHTIHIGSSALGTRCPSMFTCRSSGLYITYIIAALLHNNVYRYIMWMCLSHTINHVYSYIPVRLLFTCMHVHGL